MMKQCAQSYGILNWTKREIIFWSPIVLGPGAQPSESDRSAMVGGANMVGADAFSGFDYVALGHLHRAQEIGGNVRYSGSPVKFSFAEANTQKA